MIKYKMLSLVGFATGTAIVLLTYPPTLFDDGMTDVIAEPEPSVQATPSVTAQPTPSVAVTSSAIPEPTVKATVKPTVSATASATKSVAPTSTTKTLIGNPYSASKYGTVQVQIVVTNGVVTSAKALLFPDADSRSSAISAAAIPVLIQQSLEAKNSSDIQGASGASYTSAAWIDSLQSALAKI